MSYSVSASGPKSELIDKLQSNFDTTYPEPSPGVADSFGLAQAFVEDLLTSISDDGYFSVSVSGHSNDGEDDSARDSLSVSINPVTTPA